jgi:hypothetical protein
MTCPSPFPADEETPNGKSGKLRLFCTRNDCPYVGRGLSRHFLYRPSYGKWKRRDAPCFVIASVLLSDFIQRKVSFTSMTFRILDLAGRNDPGHIQTATSRRNPRGFKGAAASPVSLPESDCSSAPSFGD